MAWTTPATWTTGEVVTAAKMNTHVRDNLLETAPATVTSAGDLVYADGANSLLRLATGSATQLMVSTVGAPVWRNNDETIGDASYAGFGETANTDFNAFSVGAGNNVSVSQVTGVAAMVWYGAAFVANSTAGGLTILNFRISGATTVAANVNRDQQSESGVANDRSNPGGFKRISGLTAGTNTFTLQARVSTGLGTISFPYIAVQAL